MQSIANAVSWCDAFSHSPMKDPQYDIDYEMLAVYSCPFSGIQIP